MSKSTSQCPCSSSLNFSDCCEGILKGKKKPETAEALMRARYSAYTMGDIDFIQKTNASQGQDDFDAKAAKEWSEKSEWNGLEVLSKTAGGPSDASGEVEFIAKYTPQGMKEVAHHEFGKFVRENGDWKFLDGKVIQDPVKRESPKIGRNDPCPCGSGSKFKKCCAA